MIRLALVLGSAGLGLCLLAGCGASSQPTNNRLDSSEASGQSSGQTGSAAATSTATAQSNNGGTAPIDFSVVNQILTNSCGGAACHGDGAANTKFVGQQQAFVSSGADVAARLQSSDPNQQMPQPGYLGYPGLTQLTAADLATLLTYLAQQGVTAAATATASSTATSTAGGTAPSGPAPPAPPVALRCSALTDAQIQSGAQMTYQDFNTNYLEPKCGSCHNQNQNANDKFVDSPTDIGSDLAGIFIDVNNGSMPQGSALTADVKQLFLNYTCGHANPLF